MREGDRGIERQRKEGWGEVNKKGVWGKGEGGKRNGTKWKEFGNKRRGTREREVEMKGLREGGKRVGQTVD